MDPPGAVALVACQRGLATRGGAAGVDLYPKDMRLPGDVTIARREFTDMAAVLEKHMQQRQRLPDVAGLHDLYARPKASFRIAAAFANLEK